MPVYKFKTFEEASLANLDFPSDEIRWKNALEILDFGFKVNPPKFPQGVFKYKTFEEAQEHRRKYEFMNLKPTESSKSIQM